MGKEKTRTQKQKGSKKEKMTCKDCIHEKICGHFIPQGLPWDDGEFPAELFCDHFKPKSRFIELPCAVGDKIFRTSGNYCGEKIFEGVVAQISIYENGVIRCWANGHPLGFARDDFGKTVFLTKAEAETALERSSNEKV